MISWGWGYLYTQKHKLSEDSNFQIPTFPSFPPKAQPLRKAVNQLGSFGGCEPYQRVSGVLSFTVHFPSESRLVLIVSSLRAESSAGKCRLLIRTERPASNPRVFRSISVRAGRLKLPEMYFWKRGTFRVGQDKMLMRWGDIGFRRSCGCPYSKHSEFMQRPTWEL